MRVHVKFINTRKHITKQICLFTFLNGIQAFFSAKLRAFGFVHDEKSKFLLPFLTEQQVDGNSKLIFTCQNYGH